MSENVLRICIDDPTHGQPWESAEEEQKASADFKLELEAEFSVEGDFTSVGFGAASAAYVFQIPWNMLFPSGILIGALFAGRRIKQSIKGYCEAYDYLRTRIFARTPVLDRTGAACVAINEIITDLGHVPRSIQLIGYERINPIVDAMGNDDPGAITRIAADENRLKDWIHVFRIKANSSTYRIFLQRSRVVKKFREKKNTKPTS